MELVECRRRARERDAELARAAILDAGQHVVAQCGLSGAGVEDIAEASRYNRALIFHHFRDKLGLYSAVMRRTKERIFEQLDRTIERFASAGDEAPIREQIRSFLAESFRWTFDYYVGHQETPSMLAWEAAEGWQTFSSCAPSGDDTHWTEHIRAYLRRPPEGGVPRRDLDPELLFATGMSLPLIHLLSLPRCSLHFPHSDFSSSEALAHAREQLTMILEHGTLTFSGEA